MTADDLFEPTRREAHPEAVADLLRVAKLLPPRELELAIRLARYGAPPHSVWFVMRASRRETVTLAKNAIRRIEDAIRAGTLPEPMSLADLDNVRTVRMRDVF